MADATESQQATPRRRRGRPPGSKTKRRRVGGGDLIGQLNAMVAELIKENRNLKGQVEKLTARGTKAASGTVERGLRTIQRRVQRPPPPSSIGTPIAAPMTVRSRSAPKNCRPPTPTR